MEECIIKKNQVQKEIYKYLDHYIITRIMTGQENDLSKAILYLEQQYNCKLNKEGEIIVWKN